MIERTQVQKLKPIKADEGDLLLAPNRMRIYLMGHDFERRSYLATPPPSSR